MSMSTTSIASLYPRGAVLSARGRSAGRSIRLIAYVISDVHLDGETADGTLFDDRRNGSAVAALCERIAREGAELVLAGDALDLTSMTPLRKGLERFYEKMEMRAEPPLRRSLAELCARVREANPNAVEALGTLTA